MKDAEMYFINGLLTQADFLFLVFAITLKTNMSMNIVLQVGSSVNSM